VKIVDSADILVVYELDFFKSQIVNAANKNVKIIWRFFGYELYFRKLHLYLDDDTKSYFTSEIFKRRIQSSFNRFFKKEKTFRSAIERIDLMACVFEEEFKILQKSWPNLPKFIRVSLYDTNELDAINFEKILRPKQNVVVIGNSRSLFNNHSEILNLIKVDNVDPQIQLKLLFNYGEVNSYSAYIKKRVMGFDNIELIEDFIPYNEFANFYDNISAFVNNSYRQFALGNIFLSLRSGVKVYLNPKNPTYSWLASVGFKVFPVMELKKDLTTMNITLKEPDRRDNAEKYKSLLESYSNCDFQKEAIQLLYNS
jgi:dTDP-N-acetylfucosamine:lipid II N-acetylfucosaminyltransferase